VPANTEQLPLRVMSFGYAGGSMPANVLVVDCRNMRNPHSHLTLRPLTGMHAEVQQFVQESPGFANLLQEGWELAQRDGAVAFGCFGGRHRSVAMAELLANDLRAVGKLVQVEHRALRAR
jgi:RNase adapter protein RapZ